MDYGACLPSIRKLYHGLVSATNMCDERSSVFCRKLEQTSFPVNAAGPRPLPVPASLVRAFHSGHFLAYLGTIYR
jgi:hypothetical protein